MLASSRPSGLSSRSLTQPAGDVAWRGDCCEPGSGQHVQPAGARAADQGRGVRRPGQCLDVVLLGDDSASVYLARAEVDDDYLPATGEGGPSPVRRRLRAVGAGLSGDLLHQHRLVNQAGLGQVDYGVTLGAVDYGAAAVGGDRDPVDRPRQLEHGALLPCEGIEDHDGSVVR